MAWRRRDRGVAAPGAAPYPHPEVAPLAAEHVAGARVFADRRDMVAALGPVGGVVAEVGVGLGDFSDFLLATLRPRRFVAVDLFPLHQIPELWGRPTADTFGARTHREFYSERLAAYGDVVEVEQGVSWEVLERQPDRSFDLVYVDADHDYDSVRRDAAVAAAKTATDGLLVFNDYTMSDHLTASPYGVVQNVNELVVGSDWRVVGFALHPQMFCDIALRRVGSDHQGDERGHPDGHDDQP